MVPIDRAGEVVNDYPIAVAAGAVHHDLAKDFVEYVMSGEAQRVLAGNGFLRPR